MRTIGEKKKEKGESVKDDKYISRHRRDKYNDGILLPVNETGLGFGVL